MTPTPQQHVVTQTRSDVPVSDAERIVISGMSGLYPDSKNIKEFSEILYNKVNPVSEAALRFKYSHPEVVQQAGTVPGLQYFDAQFFKVHYRLGNSMDPMARKVLEQSYQAIYDAGINPDQLSGKKVGVYIGSCFSETEKACFYEAASRSGFGIAGCSKTMFANRISYWLNAKGPSMSIDEACCSSTAALEQAYLAMSRGECEAAIVGGTYLCLHPQSSVHYGRIMKLCQDGKTKSFDENADGCAKSEAINVLFLQRAKDALRVYADVVHAKSEFISLIPEETGPKYGFYRDVSKTVDFVNTFYEEARISPEAIEYVEAFGCAVPEADKVELQTIEEVFCNERRDPLLVGSVMSNIGYNEAASGITAITKVLLGYHRGEIAANLHCSSPRQDVAALREGRMRVVTEHQRFRRTYVAVNGMSVTGVNSHVLLHGRYKPKDLNCYKSSIAHLVTISARHESAVTCVLNNLKSNPIDPEQLRLLHNIHQTSISGHLGRGFTIIQTNEEQKTVSLCEKTEYFDDARRPLWFVYSGMGSQWAGMGAQLMRIPIFAAAIERCRQVLKPKGLDILHIITSPDEKTFDNILHSFVGIAAVQIGLTDILRELGLEPDGIIGHSVGELGCAYADGCLTAEEMILAAYSRGMVSLETPFIRGSMAAIGLGYEQISKLCPPEIEVACHNGPESSTISGPADVMREFVAELTAKGVFAKEVPCSNIAYHSRYIADAGPQLLKYLSEVIKSPRPRSDRWLSTSVPQERWDDPSAKLCSAEYHTNNLLSPVLFEETARLVPSNAVLVEVAPHGLLQAILKRSLPGDCKNIALTRRKHPDNTFLLLEGIGKLFMEGYNPKVHVLYPKVELPVSTGTPFLSHLVEWAHGEQWPLPIYVSANRKTSATCNYVMSQNDTENSYLQGHTIRGNTLYPYAATLVLVWDTFAMIMNAPKKQISVEFSDVRLYAQPIIHEQRQLRLSLSLHRGNGNFEVLNEGSKVATGFINEIQTKNNHHKYTGNGVAETQDQYLNISAEDIYQLLQERDYSYSGEFRSLVGVNSSLSEAALEWRGNWVTLIDGMLQLNMLRQTQSAVSLPTNIGNICIDIHEHAKIIKTSISSGDRHLLQAQLLESYGITRCAGLTMHQIKLENLPPVHSKKMVLKELKFVSYLQTDFKVSSSLEVYLQIVAENVNKVNLDVVGIVNKPRKGSVFTEIHKTIRNTFAVNVNYKQMNRESALKKQCNFLRDVDLVLVQNLSTDDHLCQLLHHSLLRDQFVVSEEDLTFGGRSRPTSLYRVLCVHNSVINVNRQLQLQLARWGASAPVPTTTVTVRNRTDIKILTLIRNKLSMGHRLLVISPYSPLPGLKELISDWRREYNRHQIHLVMVAKDSDGYFDIEELPNIDLAFNVLYNDNWGGEYYLPMTNCLPKSDNFTLQLKQIGNYDSLTWVEAPEANGPGVSVKVEYAGINLNDIKKVNGSSLFKQNSKNNFGVDFSGTTESGERVMGLVCGGAASSVVRARPELLWPVPAHWSLEDAATVPLAYAHAFYCLKIKNIKRLLPGRSVLVHGGTGALGQAAISVALAHGCKVFTTVSDIRKKKFLRKLFPALEAENIGNSRDHSFGDMIRIATKGWGCDIIISTAGKDLKNTIVSCTGFRGIFFDISQLHNQDDFAYGMSSLTRERSYTTIDFSSLYDDTNIAKALHRLMSEGISGGYVRPLSRVTYAPHDAARAFRLLAASNHRGRVLLHMRESTMSADPRLTCNADLCHLILCNDATFGLRIADWLVERGAKKLCLHYKKLSMNYLQIKIRAWQKLGVKVIAFSDDFVKETDVIRLLNSALQFGCVEGVYMTVGDNHQDTEEALLNTLDLACRKLCPNIKYFAVINIGDHLIGKEVCLRRVKNHLPATILILPKPLQVPCYEGAWQRGALEVMEKALRGAHGVFAARSAPALRQSLLHTICGLADITVSANTNKNVTLEELGVKTNKAKIINHLLRVNYNLAFEEKDLLLLTFDMIQQLDNSITKQDFEDVNSLSTFFSYIDSDELLATTDLVFLPTLGNSASMRDDEFDASQTYLCIVPGMEGHHERFRVLCERLKMPALVLQPGFDLPNESVQETAERFAKVILKKTAMKNSFYLLGYESGVPVALEMAAVLEKHGLTGTVFFIGYAPDEFGVLLEEQLSEFETKEQLQISVVCHMFTLIAGSDSTNLERSLQTASTWSEKVAACMRELQGRVPHSSQYARGLIEAAKARIERARGYVPPVRALRSRLVLLRAATEHAPDTHALQRHSQQPVAVHQLKAPLAYSARDLHCAAIINTYLDSTILEEFDKKNICDTYLINANSYMAIDK